MAHNTVTDETPDMARTSDLLQRSGRWYFNKAFPKELWSITGTAPFRVSLHTASLAMAVRLRGPVEARYWATVDRARLKLAGGGAPVSAKFDAGMMVARWLVHEAEFWERTKPKEMSEYEHELHCESLSEQIADCDRSLGTGNLEKADSQATSFLAGEGIEPNPDSLEYRQFRQLMIRAWKELALRQQAEMYGDFSYRPTDPAIVRAMEPQAAASVKRTIDDLIEAYSTDRNGRVGWSPSTKAAYAPVWRLLRDTLGGTRDVSSLTREDGRRLYEIVQGLPRNLGKLSALQGLTVPAAVQRAKALGLPTIAPKTINGSYMGCLASTFGWAVKEQWLSANPVTGLTVLDPVDAADKRDPFDDAQLKRLFSSGPWATPQGRHRPLAFWGPLIALFQGMRRGEIAQLNVADVETIEGVVVLRVRPGDEGQRVKTRASRRSIPVHAELKRLGFLEYVAQQRARGSRQLFGGEAPNSRGQWGDGLSDWFNRHLAVQGIKGVRLGMHSFRHNFEDRLRAVELHGTDLGRALAGRSTGNEKSEAGYGDGYSVGQLAAAMAKISYPNLDLSHLYRDGQ